MGKQTRRKNRNKKGSANGSNTKTAAPPSKSSLVNRIRHGDLRIRHGALSAASATLFSPESLSSRAPINMELIQAMSERVMDNDAPCAMCALGCLGNYVLFQERQTHGNRIETLLTPILLRKMNAACDLVESIAKQMVELEQNQGQTQNSVEEPKGKKKRKNVKSLNQYALSLMEQWSIQSLCLHALCGIVEGTATNNESSAILYHQREEFLCSTMRSFLLSTEMISALDSADSDMMKMIASKENQANIISDVVNYAARTMHSSCDDNPALVSSIQSLDGWKNIVSAMTNAVLPTLARLHCCGITIICHQVTKSRELEQIVVQHSLPLLSQCAVYSNDIASALHEKVAETHRILTEQQKDENMEKDIIRMVDKRRESARAIAKRQKQMKADSKLKDEEDAKMDSDANRAKGDAVDVEKDAAEEEANKAKEEAEQRYEKALNAWKNACLPLKLSVEVVTNACAKATGADGALDGDDFDEMAWDSDQEEKLLAGSQIQNTFNISKEDEAFLNQLVTAGVPDRVLAVFGTVYMTLVNGTNNAPVHHEILEDLAEVLCKCSICLGNMACNLQASWKSNENDVTSLWKELVQCLTAAKSNNISNNIPLPAIASVLSIMGAFLRFRPFLVKCVNEEDLDLILSFVLAEYTARNNSTDDASVISDIQKDAVGMLGILCSQPHPVQVNEKICDVFLGAMRKTQSTAVLSEILNALMDMYSADEGDPNNHEGVFRSKGVLGGFQKIVPVLKRKIKEDEKKDGGANPEDIEFSKETVLNATRFIRYKKGT